MLPEKTGRKSWWYLIPLLALLLAMGGAAYLLRGSGAASGLASLAGIPAMNGPVGAMSTGNGGGGTYPPAVYKTYANGVRESADVKHDLSPPLASLAPKPAQPRQAPENDSITVPPAGHVTDPVVQNWF